MTRITELTSRLLDGTLKDDEWAELESLVARDPAALDEHLSLMEVEAALRGFRTDLDLTESTLEKVKTAQSEKTTRAVMAEIAMRPAPDWAERTTPSQPVNRRRLFAVAGLLAIAAGLVIGLWLGNRDSEHREEVPSPILTPFPAFAKLTRAIGAVELLSPHGEITPVSEGGHVPPGHSIRTVGEDSVAQVQLPDRTMVDIEPDSLVRFLNPGNLTASPRLFLAIGQLTAAIPDGTPDRQLVVGTGVADVFARRGKYVVSSAGPESARVDVKQGKVEVLRANSPQPVQVARGSAMMRSGLEQVFIEPSLRTDHVAARTLSFPAPRDAMFSADGKEVWVISARQFTRWTNDGGTADVLFPPRKGTAAGPMATFTRDKRSMIASFFVNKEDKGAAVREERLLVRDLKEGMEPRELEIKLPEVRYWTAGPGASWFAAVGPKPNLKRLSILDGDGQERFARDFEQVIACITASADGRFLAVGQSDPARVENNKIVLLDPKTGSRLSALPTQRKGLSTLTFSADGRYLAAGFNGIMQVWDVQQRELVRSISGFERPLTCLSFSADARAIAGGTQDGQVWIWSVATGRPAQLIEVGSRGIRTIAFSPDGRRLLTIANSPSVLLWEVVDPSTLLSGDAE